MKNIHASIGTLILIAATLAAGCGKTQDTANAEEAGQTGSKVQANETLLIPAGTSIVAALDTQLSTKTNHTGDPFLATTTEPVVVGGRTVLPSGSRINGVLRDVEASGRVDGRAQMTLAYQTINDAQGKSHAISAQPLALQAVSSTSGDVEKIAAGGVIGGIIGGIAGGGKGAAIGAGAGAGAGVILMLATKGDDLELNSGQKLAVNMTGPLSIQVPTQR